jgi:peptidyl-prolyl cis-trans isomerase C
MVSLGAPPALAQKAAPVVAHQTAPKPAAAEKKPGVAAVVNGSEINLDTFTVELYRAERSVLNAGRPLSAPQVTRLRSEVLEALVRQELLYQEARKAVRVTDTEIAGELEKLKDQFQNTSDFTRLTPVLRVQVERALAIRKYIDSAYVSKVTVADAEIRSYYDAHRDGFRQPEQVKASYIFIKIDPQWNEVKKAEAKRKMEDVRSKALGGQDFATLARTYSEDPTAPRGGDIGYVRQGQLLKPVEEALFALKPGEVSDIVESRVGYNLVKAVERKPETTVPFEDVKDQLRTALRQEKGRQEADAYIAKVREKAAVETFLPAEE